MYQIYLELPFIFDCTCTSNCVFNVLQQSFLLRKIDESNILESRNIFLQYIKNTFASIKIGEYLSPAQFFNILKHTTNIDNCLGLQYHIDKLCETCDFKETVSKQSILWSSISVPSSRCMFVFVIIIFSVTTYSACECNYP